MTNYDTIALKIAVVKKDNLDHPKSPNRRIKTKIVPDDLIENKNIEIRITSILGHDYPSNDYELYFFLAVNDILVYNPTEKYHYNSFGMPDIRAL